MKGMRHPSYKYMIVPGGTRSALLPPVFVNKFTQKRDAASGDIVPRPGFSTSDGKFIGVQNQAGGEMAELEFFTKLGMYTLVH